jgi:hypothetical protein
MLKAYPNPFSEQTTLLITTAGHELLQLQIFDLTGKKVWHNFVYTNQNIIIGSELSVGTYIAQVIQNNGTIHNIKFIKNK